MKDYGVFIPQSMLFPLAEAAKNGRWIEDPSTEKLRRSTYLAAGIMGCSVFAQEGKPALAILGVATAGDVIDESTAAKVGKFAGAQYILLSSLAREGGKFYPLMALDYKLRFAWGVLGVGLSTGANITFTKQGTTVAYGLYSIPVAARLGYRSNFQSRLFLAGEAAPGVAFSILRYSGSGFNENSRTFADTTLFLSAKLAAGVALSPTMDLAVGGNFLYMAFETDPYLGISPGMELSFRL